MICVPHRDARAGSEGEQGKALTVGTDETPEDGAGKTRRLQAGDAAAVVSEKVSCGSKMELKAEHQA